MYNGLGGWLERTKREEYEQEIREKAEDGPSERGGGFHFQEGPKTIAAGDRKDKRTRRWYAARSILFDFGTIHKGRPRPH